MTNLIDNKPRRYRDRAACHFTSMPAPTSAATTLFVGAAVQENAGQLENGTGAGTLFAGFLEEKVTGDGTSTGTNRVEVCDEGEALLDVDAIGAANLALADHGATVYLTDGNTFTLDSTGAQAIGKVSEVPAASVGLPIGPLYVSFQGAHRRSI